VPLWRESVLCLVGQRPFTSSVRLPLDALVSEYAKAGREIVTSSGKMTREG